MKAEMEYVEIGDAHVPKIGIGTWNMRGDSCRRALLGALEMGYRHVDTAEMYGNEREVGQAIAESELPRDDLFLVTKVWTNHLRHADVLEACARSLERLDSSYVDLYLIHWPGSGVPIAETIGAMELLVLDGQVRQIGVSNFSTAQLQEARSASSIPVFCNQVKFNPHHSQPGLLSYCQEHEIMLTAYTPLGKGRVGRTEILQQIGEKYDKTAAQVALRWLIEKDLVAAIPKASNREHQRENLEIFDFSLDEKDHRAIDRLES
jgi:diketogulonate reductase-like aldo/keto reductase